MGPRQALNTCYALLVEELDSKQRQDFDTRLYGWDEANIQGDAILRRPLVEDESGGEG